MQDLEREASFFLAGIGSVSTAASTSNSTSTSTFGFIDKNISSRHFES